MKRFSILSMVGMLFVMAISCSQTPMTVAPYVGYGGPVGPDSDNMPNSWQVGVGFSFVLGGTREYHPLPVPAHPSLPTIVPKSVVNSNLNNTNTQTQSQSQEQSQSAQQINGNQD